MAGFVAYLELAHLSCSVHVCLNAYNNRPPHSHSRILALNLSEKRDTRQIRKLASYIEMILSIEKNLKKKKRLENAFHMHLSKCIKLKDHPFHSSC